MKTTTTLVCLAAALLAGACAGGDDYSPPAVTEAIPDTANQSVEGLGDYLTALTAAPADDKEPLSLERFAPQVSETDEPRTLN